MKNLKYASIGLGAALLFISTAPFALANTINIDSSSPTTPQPFSVSCAPYGAPFVSGSYYIPDEGGSCLYSLPALSGGFVVLQIYKGTLGNATLIPGDDANAATSNTVLSTSPNAFGGSQGDNFFIAAYGVNTQADLTNTENYLQTGSPLPPTVTVNLLPWIYGVKPTSPLTVTAGNQTVQVGNPIPPLTATLSGFVAPDTASSSDVTGQAACTTTATASSTAGTYPITCTVGTLASAANYTFSPFVPGTLTITPPPQTDHTPPAITITSPIDGGLYAKTDNTVHITATITDQSAIAATTYWFNGVKVNPANALPLSNAPVVSKVSVASKDIYGNAATSTVTIYVVNSVNSCLVDIVSVLTAIIQDKTLPTKPTILNLIADCSALLKGQHHY